MIRTRSHDGYHVIVLTFQDIFLHAIQGVPFLFYVPNLLPPNSVLKSFFTVKAHEIKKKINIVFS